ncbi:MAG TPA: hypothetical protein VMD91_07435 [Candidatus Sulfotelmatobacter sp.]|nr:hypothetical protein [Candidatus Sulfotelmatobacter sp.]
MATLRDFTNVHCDYGIVPLRLAKALGAHPDMALRVPVGDLHVEKDVVVHLSPKPGYPGYELFDIHWEPKEGGPYPSFAGTLSIADEGAGWSRVDLDGTYAPPLGPIGLVFDAMVGHRIAAATAALLLAEIKRLVTKPVAGVSPNATASA